MVYDGTTTSTGTYSILGQEEYNLTLQAGHRMFMWHEAYGRPYQMTFMTDQDFYDAGVYTTTEAIPLGYRMWGQDMVIEQLREPSVISVVSGSAADTGQIITVFGIVSGYPDYETITVNGITPVLGTKSFSKVERVVKDSATTSIITVTGNTGNTTVSVIPAGEATWGTEYRKIQIYPLPNTIFPINVQYYKDPYRLVNDRDVHELGGDFDQALIFLSVAILKYENNQDEGDKFAALYANELKTLRRLNMDKIDWFATLRRPKNSRGSRGDSLVRPNLAYSQVGANYGPRVN